MKTSITALHDFWQGKILWVDVSITLVHACASTGILRRNMFPGGLDKILQAWFSSSTWRVSEATIRRLCINTYGVTEGI